MKTCSKHIVQTLVRLCIRALWAGAGGLIGTGCASPGDLSGIAAGPQDGAAELRISSLTEFVRDAAVQTVSLRTLVEVVDANGFSSPVPCVMRFELYQFRPLSSDPRGKRLILWPQQDLTEAVKNSEHWKGYLRGYEFLLPVKEPLVSGRSYVLEATCLLDRRRLTDVFTVRFTIRD
jgi:hypothetical protein